MAANGFQAGCFDVARRHGVTLLTLHESVDKTAETVGGNLTPALNVYRVRLVKEKSGEEIEFEEWNGKLEYLMSQCKLTTGDVIKTPAEVIEDWRRQELPVVDENEKRFEINLPSDTVAVIPFYEPVEVSAIRFHCKIVAASTPSGTLLSRHLRELEVLQHELRDAITGGVLYKAKQADLNIGFDVKLKPGKFYAGMNGTFHYFCESIENNLATLLLLESYQHGRLLQVKFTQKLENAKGYVEVKDKETLFRLQKMLVSYNKKLAL